MCDVGPLDRKLIVCTLMLCLLLTMTEELEHDMRTMSEHDLYAVSLVLNGCI